MEIVKYWATDVDIEASREWADRIGARLHYCFDNARRVAKSLPRSYLTFGIIANCQYPQEHYWVERGGLIIDPTYVLLPRIQDPSHISYHEVDIINPGRRGYEPDEESPDYKRAWSEAMARIQAYSRLNSYR